MPLLYLRESEPFLPSDQKLKVEEAIQPKFSKGSSKRIDKATQRRLSRRTTSLIIHDAAILIIEMLQILALIQSMSLKWSWPETWIKYANFIFIFNADAWEFMKVHSEAYTQVQGLETASSDMPVNYNHILIAWGIFIFFVGAVFLIIFLILHRRQPPYLIVHHAKMERVLLIIAQIVTIPLGTVVFRLFHCTEADRMAVFDSVKCHEGLYWAYFVPGLLVVILLFGVVPVWMVYRIRSQKLASATSHHDNYLKLKEVEYMAGLDVIWAVQGFHLFSSFRLPAAYYRPFVQFAKLIPLIIFAAAFPYIYNQAVALSVILCIFALAVPIIRPFRVTSFNVALDLCLWCLAGDAVFGAVITSVTPATVESPWLVEPYSYWILIGINVIMAFVLVSWLIFLVARRFCCGKCYPNDPLWPVMMSYEYKVEGKETYKFMAAVLRGRAVLDTCIRATSVFAPVHHLARQIEIINAFCREAEKTKDGLHSTLLQLLDDMTDVYRRLEPVSLFAETVQESIRQNAARFVEMMPAFTHRMAQRDYDLILVNPVKKRLLLKMSIIGMFVNGRRKKPVRDPLTQSGLHKIWEELPDVVDLRDEVEYREDLYPGPVTGPDVETLYMAGTINRPLELMDLDDSDEEESLATFLGRVPPILVIKDEESRRNSQSLQDLMVTDLDGTMQLPGDDVFVPETSTAIIHQETAMLATETELEYPTGIETSKTGFVNPAFVHTEEDEISEPMRAGSALEDNEKEKKNEGQIKGEKGEEEEASEDEPRSDTHEDPNDDVLSVRENSGSIEMEENVPNAYTEVSKAVKESSEDEERDGEVRGSAGELEDSRSESSMSVKVEGLPAGESSSDSITTEDKSEN